MSSRIESSPQSPSPKEQKRDPSHREIVRQNAIGLAFFLNTSKVNLVSVTSIIPSTEAGILYTVAIGKIREGSDGNESLEWYSADNASIDLLQNSLDLMSKKKRKKNKQIVKNLKFIFDVVSDPTNWNKPFNSDLTS